MKTYYVLITWDETERAVAIISDGPEFTKENSVYGTDVLYTSIYLDNINIKDHTQVTEKIKEVLSKLEQESLYLNKPINFEDSEFIIFEDSDHIRYKNGDIYNRTFACYPIVYQDFNLETQTVTCDYYHNQYMIEAPNGTMDLQYINNINNLQELGNQLVNRGYVDYNCVVEMYNCEEKQEEEIPIICNVNNGKFIIPATIINKEEN